MERAFSFLEFIFTLQKSIQTQVFPLCKSNEKNLKRRNNSLQRLVSCKFQEIVSIVLEHFSVFSQLSLINLLESMQSMSTLQQSFKAQDSAKTWEYIFYHWPTLQAQLQRLLDPICCPYTSCLFQDSLLWQYSLDQWLFFLFHRSTSQPSFQS